MATEYLTVWVTKHKVKAAGGQVGYVQLPKEDADALIADGSAVDPTKFDGFTLPYIDGDPAAPAPAPAPAVKPKKKSAPLAADEHAEQTSQADTADSPTRTNT